MTRHTLFHILTASALGLASLAPLPSRAGDGIVTITLGENTELCIGLSSCLFETAPDNGRDRNGVSDHRSNTDTPPEETAQNDDPQVRDHRTPPTVRDHRSTTTVRDHRTPRPNEVVPVSTTKHDCRTGAVMLHRMGYSSINAYDCEGTIYNYTARNGGSMFRAAFGAYSGEIDVTFIGLAN